MLKHALKKILLVIAFSVFSFNLHAADWTMASGYPKSNFHTQNIMKFIDEVKATTSVNINLNENDTLIKIDAIKITKTLKPILYIEELFKSINGIPDPKKPIIILIPYNNAIPPVAAPTPNLKFSVGLIRPNL